MKRIFTLLFLLILGGSAFAQSECAYPRPGDHGVVINGKYSRYVETYSFSRHERDLQLEKVNQTYNTMLRSNMNMRFLNHKEKSRLIHRIESERTAKVRAIHARFDDYRNKFNDRYYDQYFNWRG